MHVGKGKGHGVQRLSDRIFGCALATLASGFAAHTAWQGREPWVLVGLAVALFAIALVWPVLLLPFNRSWHALVKRVSFVINYVVLGFTFVLLVIPTALMLRIFRVDPMQRRLDSKASSYWLPVFRQASADTFGDMS